MPEGDTIAKLADRIRSAVAGEPVISTITRDPRLVGVSFDGARLLSVDAIGKFLLMRFDSGSTLYSHLQMDGRWYVGARPTVPAWRRRMELEFPAATLTAVDMPEIGTVPTTDEDNVVGHLGPHLCGASPPTPQQIAARLQAAPPALLAEAMLDQRRIAGFGNVFAVEVPFLAGVAPFAPAQHLTSLDRLTSAGLALIRWSAAGHPRNTTGKHLSRPDHYLYGATTTGTTGTTGTTSRLLSGFGLTKSRCAVCGEYVAFADRDACPWGRSSWWCPTCQPADRTTPDPARLRRLLALHPAMRT